MASSGLRFRRKLEEGANIAWKVPRRFPRGAYQSVQFSRVDYLWAHESRHSRPPCPSPTLGVYSNSCPSSGWCHPAISSSVIPFSSCPQFPPASASFPTSQLFAWGGQSIGVSASASVLPMNTQHSLLVCIYYKYANHKLYVLRS